MVLLIGSSCSIRESSLMRLVPIKSCAIMTIDWASVRTGGELRRVLKGDEFEAVLRRLGIDSALVKTVVVFSAADSRTTSGLLLRGSFDRKQIGTELKNRWKDIRSTFMRQTMWPCRRVTHCLPALAKVSSPCLEPPTMSKKAFSLRKLTRRSTPHYQRKDNPSKHSCLSRRALLTWRMRR